MKTTRWREWILHEVYFITEEVAGIKNPIRRTSEHNHSPWLLENINTNDHKVTEQTEWILHQVYFITRKYMNVCSNMCSLQKNIYTLYQYIYIKIINTNSRAVRDTSAAKCWLCCIHCIWRSPHWLGRRRRLSETCKIIQRRGLLYRDDDTVHFI